MTKTGYWHTQSTIHLVSGNHLSKERILKKSSVYNKLVVTALKYTPIVLNHHVPYKEMASGKL